MAGKNEDLDKNTIFSSLLLMLNCGETWLDCLWDKDLNNFSCSDDNSVSSSSWNITHVSSLSTCALSDIEFDG